MKGPVKRGARLSVRLPDDVLDRLRVVAKTEGRSAADWAFRAIEAALVRAETQLARRRTKTDR
jgi:predicted DNA-binding protein